MEFKSGGLSSSQQRRPAAAEEGAPLARQGSVYSLTFDEFQSALGGGGAAAAGGGGGGVGKDFGSMNMDELLRSIWTAEETQAMTSTAGAGAPPAPLQRQGSSLTLPRTLSTKTVDEVWRNLVRDEPQEGAAGGGGQQQPHHRQSTLGEMTLEEFLVKAGVVRENPTAAVLPTMPPPSRPVPVAPKSAPFFGSFPSADDAAAALGFAPVGMGNQLALGNGLMPRRVAGMGGGALALQTAVNHLDACGKGNSDLSSPSDPLPYSFDGMIRGRRNGAGVEKVVERRQRRMIKNRESAARSRARKQAYTMELEAEVQKLKEQNKELERKQEELKESQKNEVPEMLKNPFGRNKRLCLRRTLTGPW
ncbi:hypothetical protein EJB05_43298 [Eragrostis curvula]|uniref:BZIP domain-containing protein n=1 Tax=Eragrostis curvula TaxID=38414 RepID=A0A5J9TEU8_9POAL|nr:hypothetical protein EJB05_43298 [Eragrostis curvula]